MALKLRIEAVMSELPNTVNKIVLSSGLADHLQYSSSIKVNCG